MVLVSLTKVKKCFQLKLERIDDIIVRSRLILIILLSHHIIRLHMNVSLVS